jgi:hypothetical protein
MQISNIVLLVCFKLINFYLKYLSLNFYLKYISFTIFKSHTFSYLHSATFFACLSSWDPALLPANDSVRRASKGVQYPRAKKTAGQLSSQLSVCHVASSRRQRKVAHVLLFVVSYITTKNDMTIWYHRNRFERNYITGSNKTKFRSIVTAQTFWWYRTLFSRPIVCSTLIGNNMDFLWQKIWCYLSVLSQSLFLYTLSPKFSDV